MRTAHLLTVRGVYVSGVCVHVSRGCACVQWGVCVSCCVSNGSVCGVCLGGFVWGVCTSLSGVRSRHTPPDTDADTPAPTGTRGKHPRPVDRQTPVKTLPCPKLCLRAAKSTYQLISIQVAFFYSVEPHKHHNVTDHYLPPATFFLLEVIGCSHWVVSVSWLKNIIV